MLSLYGQWFLSWAVLGHLPRSSLDDPKDVPIAGWLHIVTVLLMLGLMPAAWAGFIVDVVDVIAAPPQGIRIFLRFLAWSVAWRALAILWHADPGGVLYCWFD